MTELEKIIEDFRHYGVEIRHKHEGTGIAWAGFWIGFGLVLAAQIIATGKEIFK